MANVIKTVIQFRRAHTEEWSQYKHIVPAAGEPCFDLDLHTLKIGDGSTNYGDLPVIGGANVDIAADGKSILLDDGTLKLAGFDAASVGAQPFKNADGTIDWVVPAVSIDDLKSAVDTIQSSVTGLQSDIKTLQDIVGSSSEGTQPIISRVENLEGKVQTLNGNDTVEGSVRKIVKDEINAFATQMSDDGTVNTFKELVNYVANHGGEVETLVSGIADLRALVGDDPVRDQIAAAINNSGHITKDEAMDTLMSKVEAANTLESVKYEVSHKPAGTLVNYRDGEIRIMCPKDTKWVLQNSGENADKSMYYLGFKAYAPAGAVSFKEDTAQIISDDTMYYFENNDFAGIDAYGRKYSIVWLAAAKYDAETDTWAYYGEKSSTAKYIGWHYSVEWYDANGIKIAADTIRINLSNEDCHNAVEPYYMSNVVKEVSVNGSVLDVVNGRVDIAIEDALELKASEEVTIAEDGTLGIGKISWSKIAQADDEDVVFDGGGAAG